ncbi:hypothetical protein AMTR_s00052p00205230 [Amborella trichopoda]|uniref:Pectinesterase catalytic domain-containing protein n=1 Tax=Amborella trichopoda TaxID=13333 RepID=U5D4W7_AMBTC|nr:hypothetical protein AMTR_s00052p00205230 [Amborella trichopoda]
MASLTSSSVTSFNISSYQDTHYAHSFNHFYRDCHIYGIIDFIFGNTVIVLQNCQNFPHRPMPKQQNMITAHGRFKPTQETGFIFQNCTIQTSLDQELVEGNLSTYLGRPRGQHSRVVIMQSYLRDAGGHRGKAEVGGIEGGWGGEERRGAEVYGRIPREAVVAQGRPGAIQAKAVSRV